ncbi:MAG: class I SAM-dependent methyltransferase [Nanoarchaeota archaeon]
MMRDVEGSPWLDIYSLILHKAFTEQDIALCRTAMTAQQEIFSPSVSGGRILDIASGLGSTALIWAEMGCHVVGIDSDPSMIRAATLNGERYADRLSFVEGDIFSIAELFDPDSFSACYNGSILNHLESSQIKTLIASELRVAPIALIDVVLAPSTLPASTTKRMKQHGIHIKIWTEKEIREALSPFRITHFENRIAPSLHGERQQAFIILER